jgi:hypothetical protein
MHGQDLLLFKAALGLTEPWQVTSVEFDAASKRLDLRIDFPKGATFLCPECERAGLKARDTEQKTWRHLDFFQQCAARRLVVSSAQPGGTRREVPGSDGFTRIRKVNGTTACQESGGQAQVSG